jgi:autotransporter-associated beta strand protein
VISPAAGVAPFLFADGGPRTLGNNIVFAGSPLAIGGSNDLTLSGNLDLGNGNRGLRIDNGQANFTGVISGTTGIVKTGTGTAVLSGANTYSGATSIFAGVLSVSSSANLGDASGTNGILLNGGTLRATGPVSSPSRSVTLNVNSTVDAGASIALGDVSGTAGLTKTGSGTLTINSFRAPNLTVNAGRLQLAPSGQATGVSVLNTLAVAAGQLDISDNHLVDHTDGVAALTAKIASGRNGGNWSGSGIVTSQTVATTSSLTSIGIASAQQAKSLATASDTAVWAGQTVTGSDALVMYTYGGDANLDGQINVDDYGRIDLNIPLGTSGWFNGDFNYDGKIDVDDYGIIDFNVGIQGAPFLSAGGAGRCRRWRECRARAHGEPAPLTGCRSVHAATRSPASFTLTQVWSRPSPSPSSARDKHREKRSTACGSAAATFSTFISAAVSSASMWSAADFLFAEGLAFLRSFLSTSFAT